MKNNIFTLLLLLAFTPGFSQSSKYEYTGRYTPVVKKEKLNEAKLISDIMPEFGRYFVLPYQEKSEMDELLKIVNSQRSAYTYPQKDFVHIRKNYEEVFDYVSVEISALCSGKTLTAKSTGNELSPAQKNILNTVDAGTDISIKIKFRYKNWANHNPENEIKEGRYVITAVPETEAEYPGGFEQMTKYLINSIFNKASGDASKKIMQATVKFTVTEEGKIADVKISRSSTDPLTDKLLLDAIKNMPQWKPAKDSKGINVKQEFNLPFGGGGC